MSNEITLGLSQSLTNGNLKDNWSMNGRFDQSSAVLSRQVLTIGQAAEEDLSFGDVATLGRAVFQNLDDTNYVTVGPKSGGVMVPFMRLNPDGEPNSMRLEPGITVRAQADTADCDVLVIVYDN